MTVATLQRAFALADSGRCTNMTELKKALRREQVEGVDANLSGASIQKQLIARMNAAGLRRTRTL